VRASGGCYCGGESSGRGSEKKMWPSAEVMTLGLSHILGPMAAAAPPLRSLEEKEPSFQRQIESPSASPMDS